MSLADQARQFRQRWWQFLPNNHDAPILDLGCGSGEFLYFLQHEGYRNIYGVDISREQIELARQVGAGRVEVGSALSYLKQRPSCFSVINAQNVLEHFTRDELIEILDAIYASLQPGGILLAVVPNAASPWGMRTRYWDITHELSFTPSSITQTLLAVGFKDFQFLEYGPVVHGFVSAIRAGLWQLVRMFLKVYLLIEVASTNDKVFTQDMRIIARKPMT